MTDSPAKPTTPKPSGPGQGASSSAAAHGAPGPQELERPSDKMVTKMSLEEIVHLTNKIGLEYVDAKKESERHELLKPTVKAKIMVALDDGQMTETKLKRLAESDDDYIAYLEKLAELKQQSERLRVRYESYKNLFEAKRSLLSYQKAEMKLI